MTNWRNFDKKTVFTTLLGMPKKTVYCMLCTVGCSIFPSDFPPDADRLLKNTIKEANSMSLTSILDLTALDNDETLKGKYLIFAMVTEI